MSPEEQRRAWAYERISRCQTPPVFYGSLGWLDLPDRSPEKWASIILAAEKCLTDWKHAKRLEDQVFAAEASRHREAWTGTGFRPDPRIAAEVKRDWRDWLGEAG